MTGSVRNRAQGWKHAKKSGHENEEAIGKALSGSLLRQLGVRLGMPGFDGDVEIGGIGETSVPCILGGKTKSKTDLKIHWENGTHTNVSIKKSAGGQLFLIGSDRFIRGFEAHFHPIPDEAKRALALFIGGPEVLPILRRLPPSANGALRTYELRKARLVWNTLSAFDAGLAEALLHWFRANAAALTEFCFSRGLAAQESEWADFIWYRNLVGENDEDEIFEIRSLAAKATAHPDCVLPGPKNGGSTVLLPFGFLQWHQGKMQFHHGQTCLRRLAGQPMPSNQHP